jgi:hypothetical protein
MATPSLARALGSTSPFPATVSYDATAGPQPWGPGQRTSTQVRTYFVYLNNGIEDLAGNLLSPPGAVLRARAWLAAGGR